MKNEKHAFCFRFETTKEHSNQNKKNQLKQIQNQNFRFDFEIHSKLYLELFDFALYPRRESAIYMGTFRLRTLPCSRTLVRFCKRTLVPFTH